MEFILNQLNHLNERFTTRTALCYQHYFCNTELNITTETNKRTLDLDTTEHVCIIYTI